MKATRKVRACATGRPIYPHVRLTARNAPHLRPKERAARSLWLNALFSQSYFQGTEMLRKKDVNGMCCQGVACDLYDEDGWSMEMGEYVFTVGGEEAIADWDELSSVWRGLGLRTSEDVLAYMNDGNTGGLQFELNETERYNFREQMSHPEIAMAVLLCTYAGVM